MKSVRFLRRGLWLGTFVATVWLTVGPLAAQNGGPLTGKPRGEPKAIDLAAQILIQMEHDWSEADVKKDAATLNRIMAEDWVGIDFQGTVMNKAQVLAEVEAHSDETATQQTVLGDMHVRIYGNTALVSGTEVEKSQYRGEDSSGEYIWTDVFVQRNARWQAVSSQSTKMVRPRGERLARAAGSPEGRKN